MNSTTSSSNNLFKKSKHNLYSIDAMKNSTTETYYNQSQNQTIQNQNQNQNINHQEKRSISPKRNTGFSELLKTSKVLSKLPMMINNSINPYKNSDMVNLNYKI